MSLLKAFKSNWCWACLAKAGFAVGVVAIILGRRNPYVPLLAFMLSLIALIFHKREHDQQKHGQLVFFASIGLTLGFIMFLIGLFA